MPPDWTAEDPSPPPDDVILDALPLPLLVLDEACRVIRFNRPAERLTGHYRSKVVGRSCAEVLAATPCDEQCPIRRVLSTGAICHQSPLSLRNADGHRVAVGVLASPLPGPRGRTVGVVALLAAPASRPGGAASAQVQPWATRKQAQERLAVKEALHLSGGNIARAAQLLGVHRSTLWRKIRRLGVAL